MDGSEAGGWPLESSNPPYALSGVLIRRFLVRDLLWCESCDAPWVPILLGTMARYYACTNRRCTYPAMPAKVIDHRVWTRFVRLNGSAVQAVPREGRHGLLRQALKRVVVGRNLTDLKLELRGRADLGETRPPDPVA